MSVCIHFVEKVRHDNNEIEKQNCVRITKADSTFNRFITFPRIPQAPAHIYSGGFIYMYIWCVCVCACTVITYNILGSNAHAANM